MVDTTMKHIKTFSLLATLAIITLGCEALDRADQALIDFYHQLTSQDKEAEQTSKPTAPTAPPKDVAPVQNPQPRTEPPTPTANEPIAEQVKKFVDDALKKAADEINANLPEQVPTADPERELKKTLRGYTQCFNRVVSRTRDSYKRYLSWVDKAKGPTCKEARISYGLYTLYEDSVKTCREAAAHAPQQTPQLLSAHQQALKLAECNAALVPLVQTVEDYYDQEDYKDDACAKGKKWHPELISLFEQCISAAKLLSQELMTLNAELDSRELTRLEKQGPSFELHNLRLLICARQLMQSLPSDGTKTAINSSQYLERYKKCDADYQALNSYAKANEDTVSKVFWGSVFLGDAKDFYIEAKKLRRVFEANEDPRHNLNSFINEYNSMVRSANNLRY